MRLSTGQGTAHPPYLSHYLLKILSLEIDPAPVSTPVIITIMDGLVLVFYFLIAGLILQL